MSESQNDNVLDGTTTIIPVQHQSNETQLVRTTTNGKTVEDGEEEESSSESGEDTPREEEEKAKKILAMVEGMEAEAKELFLGKEGVEGGEHEVGFYYPSSPC